MTKELKELITAYYDFHDAIGDLSDGDMILAETDYSASTHACRYVYDEDFSVWDIEGLDLWLETRELLFKLLDADRIFFNRKLIFEDGAAAD